MAEDNIFGIDTSFLTTTTDEKSIIIPTSPTEISTGKKRGRPKKSESTSDAATIVETTRDLPIYQTNQSYLETYNETNSMLRAAINQADYLNQEIMNQVDEIKGSKTLKNKYNYLSDLISASGSMISTKVSAIREMNSSITKSHDLELKRMKEMKVNEAEVNDDKYIQDIYSAFISMPRGSVAPLPTTDQITFADSNNIKVPIMMNNGMVGAASGDPSFDNYMRNLTPTQNAMLLEQNQNVKSVVVYDAATGNRWFDVIDVTTGQSVPNVERKDPMFLEDTTLDVKNGVARNTNLDETYPLVVLNKNDVISEY